MLIGDLQTFDPEKPEPEIYPDDDRPRQTSAKTRHRRRALDEIAILAAEQEQACAWAAEMSMQVDREQMCQECGHYPADYPAPLCQGCNAYKEHVAI